MGITNYIRLIRENIFILIIKIDQYYLNIEVIKQLESIQYERDRPTHPKNGHDDVVMSMALAYYVVKDIPIYYEGDVGNMCLEEWKRIKRARAAKRTLPWNVRGGDGKGRY